MGPIRMILTTEKLENWKSVEPINAHPLDQLLAQYIQVCPIRTCSKCKKELVTADFNQKRGGHDRLCKSCVSKSKAKRYKRKKVNQAIASKRVIQLVNIEKFDVVETQLGPIDMNAIQPLLEDLVFDAIAQNKINGGICDETN